MNSAIYKIRSLIKEYDNRRVLEIPELDIQQGEIFALVGPSGSGKSTLLRMLNFLEPPTSGSIYFQDQEFNSNLELPLTVRRRVTTVFQRPILLDQNVWTNVVYGLGLRGQRDTKTIAHSVLEQVGLAHLATQRARTISGGEAQRVALARAMILRPDALLLDEPTANLDPYNIKIIEDIVKKANIERGTTLVLVTHNVFQARRLAHRIALILDGKLIEVSDAEKFFQTPQDERTAAFVRGDMVY
jgi:tungstate transport system ATP-binding protein